MVHALSNLKAKVCNILKIAKQEVKKKKTIQQC